MTAISLEGKVAIVSGAGRGLGRAYAEELAARGAAVVVNDLGTDSNGGGADTGLAQQVAADLRARGFGALGSGDDVTSESGGAAIIQAALDAFGTVDIIVTNAGICSSIPFEDSSLEDFRRYWDVHVGGTINLVKPAWAGMKQRGYGRIIMVESSAGLFGLEGQATYAAAKGAIHGLMRTLALEGEPFGIKVNAVLPGGYSRMTEAALDDEATLTWMRDWMQPELVAPVVSWLASEACPVAGQAFSAWAGRVARVAIGTGTGLFDRNLSAEMVAERLDEVMAADPLFQPHRNLDEVSNWLAMGLIPATGA